MTDKLEELAEELDIELEDDASEHVETVDVNDVDIEAREATVIKPFKPGNGFVKDETYNYVLENGNQFSLTVKNRPECPSCKHVLAEPDEPNQLAGECSVCGKQTCHRNQSRCEGCGTIFCPEHAKGHGLKDGAYCSNCLGDIVEDIGFERGMEKRKQGHSEEMDRLEKELKQEKQAKELELKEAKQERDQIRKDWKIIIQLLATLKNDDSDDDSDKDECKNRSTADVDSFSGIGDNDPFTGSGAFTGNKDFSNDTSGDSSNAPDWLKNEFEDIEEEEEA